MSSIWDFYIYNLKPMVVGLNDVTIKIGGNADKIGPCFYIDGHEIYLPTKYLEDVTKQILLDATKEFLGEYYNHDILHYFVLLHEYKHYIQSINNPIQFKRGTTLERKLRDLSDQFLMTDEEFHRIHRALDIEIDADNFAKDFIIEYYDKLNMSI